MFHSPTKTVSPSVFLKGWRRSPCLSSCTSPLLRQQRSPKLAEDIPSPVNLSLSPVAASFNRSKIPKRRKQYSIKEKLHYFQKMDQIICKHPNQSLRLAGKKVNVEVSLLSRWKKQYDCYLLLSDWTKNIRRVYNTRNLHLERHGLGCIP